MSFYDVHAELTSFINKLARAEHTEVSKTELPTLSLLPKGPVPDESLGETSTTALPVIDEGFLRVVLDKLDAEKVEKDRLWWLLSNCHDSLPEKDKDTLRGVMLKVNGFPEFQSDPGMDRFRRRIELLTSLPDSPVPPGLTIPPGVVAEPSRPGGAKKKSPSLDELKGALLAKISRLDGAKATDEQKKALVAAIEELYNLSRRRALTEDEKLLTYCQCAHIFEQNGDPKEHAEKLERLFGKAADAFKTLGEYAGQTKSGGSFNRDGQFVHDACLFTLPSAPEVTETDSVKRDAIKKEQTEIEDAVKKILKGHFADATVRAMIPQMFDMAAHYNAMTLSEEIKKECEEIKKEIHDKMSHPEPKKKNAAFKTRVDVLLQKCAAEIQKINKDIKQERAKESKDEGERAERKAELERLNKKLAQELARYAQLCKACKKEFHELPKEGFLGVRSHYLRSAFPELELLVQKGLSKENIAQFVSLDRTNAGRDIPSILVTLEGYPQYYMRKLEVASDARDAVLGACLGKLTGCCQSIGDAGSMAAVHGLTSPYGGFYVICKKLDAKADPDLMKDIIVAQSWVWRSTDEGLVFDSVEGVVPIRSTWIVIAAFYKEVAEHLRTKHGISRTTVGSTNIYGLTVGKDDFGGLSPIFRLMAQGSPKDEIGYRTDSEEQKVLLYEDTDSLLKSKDWDESKKDTFIQGAITSGMLAKKISTATDLYNIFACLNESQKTTVYNSLKGRLGDIIKSGEDFEMVVGYLTGEQKTTVFDSFKDKFSDIIKSANDFALVVAHLAADQKTTVCDSFKDKFGGIIKSANDFARVVEYLNPEQITAVCESLKDKFGGIIRDDYELRSVLSGLNPEQITAVCESLKDKFGGIIRDDYELRSVLSGLNPEQITAVCDSFKDKFGGIIKSANDFEMVVNRLTDERRAAVCESFKDKFSDIVESVRDFEVVVKYLTDEQRAAVCGSCEGKFGGIIKSAKDFEMVVKYLTYEQRDAVYESFKDKFSDIVESVRDFALVVKHLTNEQRAVVCGSCKGKFGGIIKSANDFEIAVRHLAYDQKTTVYESFKDKFSDIIKSRADFETVVRHLTDDQKTTVCESFKDKFSDIVKSGADFEAVVRHLTDDQKTTVCESFKDKFGDIIKSSIDLGSVLINLNPGQITAVCKSLEDKLSSIIKVKGSWGLSFWRTFGSQLNPEQITAILKGRSGDCIKSVDDFKLVLSKLDPEQITAVCASLKGKLGGVIKSRYEFNCVVKELTCGQITAVCESLKDEIGNFINSPYSVKELVNNLTAEQIAAVCEPLKGKLDGIIKSSYDFLDVVKDLTSQQITAVCKSLKDKFGDEINSSAVCWGAIFRRLEGPQIIAVCESLKDKFDNIIKSSYDIDSLLSPLDPSQKTAVRESLGGLMHAFPPRSSRPGP